MASQLTPGQRAPDFELVDDRNKTRTLREFRGHPLIVYFYPKAETPGCTTEACDFRDSLASLRASGYEVVGISPDEPEALRGFRDHHSLPFPLLSDPDHAVIEAWGAWGRKTVNGEAVTGVIRSTIVLSADGVVALARYNVAAQNHVAQLKEELGLG